MIGKILSIENNMVKVKLAIDLKNQANLINLHVVFEEEGHKIVGEIVDMDQEFAKIMIVGEFRNSFFLPGFNKKPAFKSTVRIINMEELAAILGDQTIKDPTQIRFGLSNIYNHYKINVNVNSFFSNHFAVLGNTGSGKSFTVSRLLQNIFTSSEYVPVGANILLFDAYGEYTQAFSRLSEISPMLNYKVYTTNTIYPETEVLRIPLWLMGVDDLALLLGVTTPNQIPILEKTLKLVLVLKGGDDSVVTHKNDIIARAIVDILLSGNESSKIRDQVTAILTNFHTKELNLESQIAQPGYIRTLKQCLYVDKIGKMQDMEVVVDFMKQFIVDGLELPAPNGTIPYTLKDLEQALDFALISEGILKSERVFDYANILSVRLHTLINSEASQYFTYPNMITKTDFVHQLMKTPDNKKCQIVNFNINYVDDRMAKVITKILSKMVFDVACTNPSRGSEPFHIIIEEAHRYVQKDMDVEILGYNIFERITKEGRKYGVLLGLITQRPSELSETAISQCSNFVILRTLHPKDLEYIRNMVPNISSEIVEQLKTLQPGNCIAFGNAFKVPISMQIEKPNPEPLSNNANISKEWYQVS